MTFSLLPGFASCSLHELLNSEAQAICDVYAGKVGPKRLTISWIAQVQRLFRQFCVSQANIFVL
jgi:hypothetical protein